jgi:hypothetical protein
MYSTATLDLLVRSFLPPVLARLVPVFESVSSRDAAWQRIASGRGADRALL